MLATVQAFIHHQKGVEVQINFRPQDLGLLIRAYDYAIAFFQNNNGTIQIL